MSVFVHAQGIKLSMQRGGRVKKWQNTVHVVVECPLRPTKVSLTGSANHHRSLFEGHTLNPVNSFSAKNSNSNNAVDNGSTCRIVIIIPHFEIASDNHRASSLIWPLCDAL